METGYIFEDEKMKCFLELNVIPIAEDYRKFILKREEYTFQEAFGAYEEEKEIESCYKEGKINE